LSRERFNVRLTHWGLGWKIEDVQRFYGTKEGEMKEKKERLEGITGKYLVKSNCVNELG